MRLYTLTGATQVDDPTYGSFTAASDGSFEFPNELSARLHAFHEGGKPAWEDDAERETRLAAEQLEQMRDPATLLAAVQALASHQAELAAAVKTQRPAPDAPPAEPKPSAKTTTRRASKRPAAT